MVEDQHVSSSTGNKKTFVCMIQRQRSLLNSTVSLTSLTATNK